MSMPWSAYQERIFEEVRNGTGNVVVMARAGSGKTTTIIESMKHAPPGSRVLFCAFNKRIQEELADRVPDGVDAMTLHSIGFRAVRNMWGNVEVNDRRIDPKIRSELEKIYEECDLRTDTPKAKLDFSEVRRLIGLAKNCLCTTHREIERLGVKFDVWGGQLDLEDLAEVTVAVLAQAQGETDAIDFDDMIWLPIVRDMALPAYDLVFIDEAQDLNPCQIEIVRRLRSTDGRIIAVGDNRQAIYGFRGADGQAIENVVSGIQAKTLPLSISYRCARRIVEAARVLVPDIEPAPDAIDGTVGSVFYDRMFQDATPGDFVLSRTNAKAVEACLGFIRRGAAARVVGRDIGKSVRSLLKKSRANTPEELCAWLVRWETRMVKRAERRADMLGGTADEAVVSIHDKADTLMVIAAESASMDDVEQRISQLFGKDDDADAAVPAIVCSTVHKAKGLEADRVWLLAKTFDLTKIGSQAANLLYVAVTRARKELFMVSGNRVGQVMGRALALGDLAKASILNLPPVEKKR